MFPTKVVFIALLNTTAQLRDATGAEKPEKAYHCKKQHGDQRNPCIRFVLLFFRLSLSTQSICLSFLCLREDPPIENELSIRLNMSVCMNIHIYIRVQTAVVSPQQCVCSVLCPLQRQVGWDRLQQLESEQMQNNHYNKRRKKVSL